MIKAHKIPLTDWKIAIVFGFGGICWGWDYARTVYIIGLAFFAVGFLKDEAAFMKEWDRLYSEDEE